MIRNFIAATLVMATSTCLAGTNWQVGHINNMTVADDEVYVKLDSGLPDNCTGTSGGWMIVPSASKALKALVLALWARGDMTATSVQIYTNGLVGSYCEVDQIDPYE